jgi:hypothetical protein
MQQQRYFTPVASYKTNHKKIASPKPFPRNSLSQLQKVEVAADAAATVCPAHPVAAIRTKTKNL